MELSSRISAKTVYFTLNRLMEKFKWYIIYVLIQKINNHTGNFHQMFIIAFTRYEINTIGSFYAIYRYLNFRCFPICFVFECDNTDNR